MKQKRAFRKIFCSIKFFLELKNLDDLVNFSELSMFVNASHIYWMKWTGGLGREKKNVRPDLKICWFTIITQVSFFKYTQPVRKKISF